MLRKNVAQIFLYLTVHSIKEIFESNLKRVCGDKGLSCFEDVMISTGYYFKNVMLGVDHG